MACVDNVAHDIQSILSSSERNYLVRNNGDQVKIESLKGKKVGLYFSASWCGPCRRFTPTLVELYNQVSAKGDFEIVFLSIDKDEDAFKGYFSKMPWLAIPFSDSDTRNHLNGLFKMRRIPLLVILDENGKVATENGTEIVSECGAEAYPFTLEKIKELKDQEEEGKRNQSLRSLLVFKSRDYVISSDGKQVPVSQLEGKTVGLYFSSFSFRAFAELTPKVVEVYEKLKGKGEDFEIVFISVRDDEESFKQGLKSLPLLALPFNDKSCEKLARHFELSNFPALVVIGPDGKTLHSNVADAIEKHGAAAYPFTPEKFAELSEIEKAKEAAQTLESILISGDLDFLIGKDGIKIPVSDLVGKTILLYFSAHWCPPCRAFLPKLIESYHKIKAKQDSAVEVVFISSDRDLASFNDFFAGMPWLALPFGDSRKSFLSRKFKAQGIPMLVAIGPGGQILTKDARNLVALYGAEAYPFTEERVKELEATSEEMPKGWPEKVAQKSHEHELVLTRRGIYICDGCNEEGHAWSYCCDQCDFDLHPKCALEEEKPKEENKQEGRVCDGEGSVL
ncbi:probable nucleoredoxin 1 [Neltuma alba]|uniref:probable nucleoredoxin 1 n=1 Tax=Neltuma alba TaxID=207710 RepID=UPI0010A3CF18|nr:probable nucleoredoxin 1 [Prosopis alba]